MRIDTGHIGAVVRKEVRDYRRSRSVVGTMTVLPLIFLVEPTLVILRLSPSTSAGAVQKSVGSVFLLLLIAPAIIPAVTGSPSSATPSAAAVIGESARKTVTRVAAMFFSAHSHST